MYSSQKCPSGGKPSFSVRWRFSPRRWYPVLTKLWVFSEFKRLLSFITTFHLLRSYDRAVYFISSSSHFLGYRSGWTGWKLVNITRWSILLLDDCNNNNIAASSHSLYYFLSRRGDELDDDENKTKHWS